MRDNLIHLTSTSSTNDYLHHLISCDDSLTEGLVIWSDFQTEGKGQISNVWESEAGQNLTFSMLFFPSCVSASEQFLLSQFVSLGIVDYLRNHVGLSDVTIKWPNDIYWKNKKICGILIENLLVGSSISHTIVGVGLNVNQKKFLSDAPNPVSMAMATKRTFNLEVELPKLVDCIKARYLQLIKNDFSTIRAQYFNSMYHGDSFYYYTDDKGSFAAKIDSVANDGILSLRLVDGEVRKYAFKEVTFIVSNK
ncbi:MAG: biotin--[Paludibacteraceae bacterium]|nr:biotin--[acetyl-CoA-carboxylase] ligase [Paludibacteraceae bacterium]